jgi:hypothetical protein
MTFLLARYDEDVVAPVCEMLRWTNEAWSSNTDGNQVSINYGACLAGDYIVIKRMTDDRLKLNAHLVRKTGRYFVHVHCETGES